MTKRNGLGRSAFVPMVDRGSGHGREVGVLTCLCVICSMVGV